jgi:hypothetical protein
MRAAENLQHSGVLFGTVGNRGMAGKYSNEKGRVYNISIEENHLDLDLSLQRFLYPIPHSIANYRLLATLFNDELLDALADPVPGSTPHDLAINLVP